MISKKKFISAILAISIVAALAVGGTLAYLTDKTDPVTNTFTVGNVKIALAETTSNYKMVPGQPIDKDPKVTIKAKSEECYVFVKIDESANLKDFITYGINDGWTKLTGEGISNTDIIYYRVQSATTADTTYSVLKTDVSGTATVDKVLVKTSVTPKMMDDITAGTASAPTLTFTAYAIQKAGFDTPLAAWNEVSTAATQP